MSGGRSKRSKGHGGKDNTVHTLASIGREVATSFAADSPVLAIFKDAAKVLTDRQDRHERLVKLSRDITVESKRIIFLLHSSITPEMSESTIAEAKERIQKLINAQIRSIGLELEHSPAHLHSRAVTAGFQEYVEARTFLSLMSDKRIITYPEVQKELEFAITEGDNQRSLVTFITHTDYMLGVADLTGELMRKAINSTSSGDTEVCYRACDVLRQLYTGYLGVTGCRPLVRKLQVTQANVHKVEMAVYTMRIRGGERPLKLLLSGLPAEPHNAEDEGYA